MRGFHKVIHALVITVRSYTMPAYTHFIFGWYCVAVVSSCLQINLHLF